MLCPSVEHLVLVIGKIMDIKSALMSDPMQSKARATQVANCACGDSGTFEKLVHCFLSDDYRLCQRAALSLRIAAQQRPDLIAPHIGVLVDQLARSDIHNAVIRNSVRILQDVAIPVELHGKVMAACFDFVQSRQIAIAIRAFSLTILEKLSIIYPEIRSELGIIIEEAMEYETPAFRSRGRKILARIKRQKPS